MPPLPGAKSVASLPKGMPPIPGKAKETAAPMTGKTNGVKSASDSV